MTMIIRNAFGGAYAAYNSHFTGADLVFAMPMARVAVMGAAGKEFVFKGEMRAIAQAGTRRRSPTARIRPRPHASEERDEALAKLTDLELRRPADESEGSALSRVSVSRIVMPGESRRILARNLGFLMRKYTAGADGRPAARARVASSPAAASSSVGHDKKRDA